PDHPEFRPLVMEADGSLKDPGGTLADRFSESGVGHWNLDLDGVNPVMSMMDVNSWEAVEIALPRFDLPSSPDQTSLGAGIVHRGVPA
ncbi:nitrate reductase subunit alpha, partial [Pectobacterium brasiliense]|nr:nitrate reductase subunit alpha [Pectobacterium brasiliense]